MMDGAKAVIAPMLSAMEKQLQALMIHSDRITRWAMNAMPASTILLMLLTGAGALRINREIARRQDAADDLQRNIMLLNMALEGGKIGYWEMNLNSMKVRRSPGMTRSSAIRNNSPNGPLQSFWTTCCLKIGIMSKGGSSDA